MLSHTEGERLLPAVPVTKLVLFHHLLFDHSNGKAKNIQSGLKGSVTLDSPWGHRAPLGLKCGDRGGPTTAQGRGWEGSAGGLLGPSPGCWKTPRFSTAACFFKILRRLRKSFPSCESGASAGAGTWRAAAETSPAHGLLVCEAPRQRASCAPPRSILRARKEA